MLQISGVLQVIPVSVVTEPGQLSDSESNETQPAVVQTINTLNGPIQVVWPVEHIDTVTESLIKAKELALEEKPATTSGDLYIPGSDLEVEQIKAAHDKVNEGKN